VESRISECRSEIDDGKNTDLFQNVFLHFFIDKELLAWYLIQKVR